MKFKAYVIGKRLQTERVIEAVDKSAAIFRFAAEHGLKTYEVMVRVHPSVRFEGAK